MSGYGWAILVISCALLIFTVASLVFMCLYNSDRFWNVKKYELCRILTLIGSCLCALWNSLIWIIYMFCC